MGEVADDEYFQFFDSEDEEARDVECERCGASGLHWEETDTAWRLCEENGDFHDCHLAEAAEGFERIT